MRRSKIIVFLRDGSLRTGRRPAIFAHPGESLTAPGRFAIVCEFPTQDSKAMPAPLARACVMGHPVAHSRSPMIHGYWLKTLGIEGAYELKDLAPEAFPEFVTRLAPHAYVRANVPLPHKQL